MVKAFCFSARLIVRIMTGVTAGEVDGWWEREIWEKGRVV